MIYLDNAATTYHKPKEMINAVIRAMEGMGNAGRGAYEESLEASRLIYDTRKQLSDLFHLGNPSQVAFTSNGTQSLNIAIQGLLSKEDHIITTALEHNSVLRPLYKLQNEGSRITIISSNKNGTLNYEDFERAIRKDTRAIVCTHASNLTGNVTNLSKIGALCVKYHLLFILDASQTAGILEINMKENHIDVLCFTGHKGLFGPQGTGGICVREGLRIRPLLVGGSGIKTYSKEHPDTMPTALEAGTINGHGIAGLHGALTFIKKIGMEAIRKREQELMWEFYQGIFPIPGVVIYGDFSRDKFGCDRIPIVTMNIKDYDSGEVADELYTAYGICTRAGAHCAPLLHEALGTKEQGAVRFSFSYFNTKEEINQTIMAVKELAKV